MDMIEVEDFVHSGLFKNREVIRNALRHLTQAYPEYRLRLAIYRYQKGKNHGQRNIPDKDFIEGF